MGSSGVTVAVANRVAGSPPRLVLIESGEYGMQIAIARRGADEETWMDAAILGSVALSCHDALDIADALLAAVKRVNRAAGVEVIG